MANTLTGGWEQHSIGQPSAVWYHSFENGEPSTVRTHFPSGRHHDKLQSDRIYRILLETLPESWNNRSIAIVMQTFIMARDDRALGIKAGESSFIHRYAM